MTMLNTSPASAPESICVSLEWAKKLKEASWPQDSLWFWVHHYIPNENRGMTWEIFERDEDDRVNEHCAAPTAEEILRRLPSKIEKAKAVSVLEIQSLHTGGFAVYYANVHDKEISIRPCDGSLANAAAAMYCYLSENNLLPSSHA